MPEEFAKDADRVARFQREAKLLASLNHPNIGAIYGFEESAGTNVLVLELVEGETLADQLKRGPIPVEESLKLALQIAEALEAAHEKGVIHRDLKPANIKVTPDGKVKVLDFGLAKAFAPEQTDINLSNSPTISQAATMQGVILGTAAYMSPEQARGKAVDRRTDVWAFGCVLFEMLTGKSLFSADNVSQTLARVLERQPDFSSLPPNLHPKVAEMLERCLEKEAKNRYGSISDARVDIRKALADPEGLAARPIMAVDSRTKRGMILPWIVAVLGIAVAAVALWNLKKQEPRRVARFYHELPKDQQLAGMPLLAVSPDGSQFVYCTTGGLYLRSLENPEARHIPGTDGNSSSPFFSPDGKWIGYHQSNQLKKIAISGGAPVALCESTWVYGADWNADDTILFSEVFKGVMRVSAGGGTPENLVKGLSQNPQILPDGKSIVFTGNIVVTGNVETNNICVQILGSGNRKTLFSGRSARYTPTGHLVYLTGNNDLHAVPFDRGKLEVQGESIRMVEGVQDVAISNSGTLIYVPGTGTASGTERTLVWVDGKGNEELVPVVPSEYSHPRISPDGTKVALTVNTAGTAHIWIWDFVRRNMTRLTSNKEAEFSPLWTPDGKKIAFLSQRNDLGVYIRAADGTGEEEKFGSVSNASIVLLSSWSGDGKTLILDELTEETSFDVRELSRGDHSSKPLLNGNYAEANARISPDGRWIVYLSEEESGQREVYVRSYPDVNKGKWKISNNGGQEPRWSPNGRELFYRRGQDAMMVVAFETEPTFKPGIPRELFRGHYYSLFGHNWDLSPDGNRFLMIKEAVSAATEAPRRIHIVLNWFEELKQRVPVR